ncbi:Hypothetical protein D9617_29g006980 [Elsinoe fawcettii]|nr:Hypothetical protein D9617_29g006980 [Elsinoe fawcettii]
MKQGNMNDHLAVLIDADNVSYKILPGLLAELADYGTAHVRRSYGDWTSPSMRNWSQSLLENSVTPIQQFAYSVGKNATDGAMIIDAMDLLYTGRFSGFCLVTSDSDFTRLAARIREQGLPVYGFGNRHKTHRAFIAACTKFVFLDALPGQMEENDETRPSASPRDPRALNDPADAGAYHHPWARTSPSLGSTAANTAQPSGSAGWMVPYKASIQLTPRPIDQWALDGLWTAVSNCSPYEADFVNLAEVGNYLIRISPDLNAANYGYPKLRPWLEASGLVEIKMKQTERGPPIALVRLKEEKDRRRLGSV